MLGILLAAVHLQSLYPPYVPDPIFTPGLEDPRLTVAVLLAPGFTTTKYRPSTTISNKLKKQVMQAYGIPVTPATMKQYEGDHLVSIEIGGATDAKNFWPEPWHYNLNGRDVGAVVKDRVENAARRALKTHTMTLGQVDEALASDWIGLYKKLVDPELPKYPYGHAHMDAVPH